MLFQKEKMLSTSAVRALIAGVAVCCVPNALYAQAATPLPPVAVDVTPDESGLDHPLTAATVDKATAMSKASTTYDAAKLLDGLAGVTLYSGGGFSSLPAIRGLNDDRINTLINGVPVIAACPNHMNSALSYVPPSSVSSIEVLSGITPVSKGGDSIAGSIDVQTASPVFATNAEAIVMHGSLSAFYKSVNRAVTLGATSSIANDQFSFAYSGSGTRAQDYKDGEGNRIASSSYRGQNHAVTIAARGDSSLIELEVGMQDVPYEGFPNQFMDMLGNQSRFANGHVHDSLSWGELDMRAYWRYTSHYMNFLHDRYTTSSMPMDTKETEAGYAVKGDIPLSDADKLRVGNEFHYSLLKDWWPQGTGTMAPNVFINLNNANRNRVGTYVEWESTPDAQWTTLIGLRNDVVWMDTGTVQGYNSASYASDATAFNALNHQKTDINFDATLLARFEASDTHTDEIGYAHKTRSPNVYERYSWSKNAMASDMIGWFGDANGYVGNVDLKPEEANIISFTAGWHDSGQKDWSVKLTPYYNYIRNYIGVDYVGSNAMMAPGSSLLRFANHDAMTYGIDLSGEKTLLNDKQYGHVALVGTSSLQHGYTINNGNSLYHMMPLTLSATLNHQLGDWSNALEIRATASKSQADPLRQERFTPGFAVINFRSAYEWRNFRLDAGIDNLLNQQYYSPLGGVDLADWKANGGTATTPLNPLASPGRSYNAGMTIKF